MGIFDNKYPYTDFHELNLDYILNRTKELELKVDELINQYKDYEHFLQEAKDYTDSQIAEVNANIGRINSAIAGIENTLYVEVRRLTALIDDTKAELQTDIDTKYVRNQQAISQVWEDMKNYIAGQVFDIKVRNFFTGQLVSIQSMFDYLAGLHLTDSGTYAQVSNNNTYQHYVSKNETYTNVILSSLTFFNS